MRRRSAAAAGGALLALVLAAAPVLAGGTMAMEDVVTAGDCSVWSDADVVAFCVADGDATGYVKLAAFTTDSLRGVSVNAVYDSIVVRATGDPAASAVVYLACWPTGMPSYSYWTSGGLAWQGDPLPASYDAGYEGPDVAGGCIVMGSAQFVYSGTVTWSALAPVPTPTATPAPTATPTDPALGRLDELVAIARGDRVIAVLIGSLALVACGSVMVTSGFRR